MLKVGSENPCPNYKCKSMFTCEAGKDYMQHAVTCRPLYTCKHCGSESGRETYMQKHELRCLAGEHKNRTGRFKKEFTDVKRVSNDTTKIDKPQIKSPTIIVSVFLLTSHNRSMASQFLTHP